MIWLLGFFLFFSFLFGLVLAKLGWRPLLLKGFDSTKRFSGLEKKEKKKIEEQGRYL